MSAKSKQIEHQVTGLLLDYAIEMGEAFERRAHADEGIKISEVWAAKIVKLVKELN